MDINKNDKGVSFTNADGQTVSLTWYEFWEICRHGRMIDTVSEVTEYIRECDEIAGVRVDKILKNDEVIKTIVDQVIDVRIGYESGDDIWDVANAVVEVLRYKL